MKVLCIIKISFSSPSVVNLFFDALLPEVKTSELVRTKVSLYKETSNLFLKIEAKDTVALRAILNSYLRWVSAIYDCLITISKIPKIDERSQINPFFFNK